MNTDGMMIDSVKRIHSHEEILQALQVIKDICNQHERSCEGCPFYILDEYDAGGCKICNDGTSPSEWNIKDNNDNWKAFK